MLRKRQTGVEVTRQANGDGHYIFDFVEPGEYIVVVEQTGFKKAVQENVIVRNRATSTVDLKLSVGGVQETVTVEAPPIAVQFGFKQHNIDDRKQSSWTSCRSEDAIHTT